MKTHRNAKANKLSHSFALLSSFNWKLRLLWEKAPKLARARLASGERKLIKWKILKFSLLQQQYRGYRSIEKRLRNYLLAISVISMCCLFAPHSPFSSSHYLHVTTMYRSWSARCKKKSFFGFSWENKNIYKFIDTHFPFFFRLRLNFYNDFINNDSNGSDGSVQ